MSPDAKPLLADYNPIAAEYAAKFQHEMDSKPFDRKMLDWLIEKTAGLGPICDLGCGPGQIARYLHSRGAAVRGIDLSAAMIAEASRLNPEIPFEQGDMRTLEGVADSSLGGIAAFYSIIHIPNDDAVRTFATFLRVLEPGGAALLAFHLGDEMRHFDESMGKPVSLDFHFRQTAQVREWLTTAGFTIDEAIERDPYPPEIEFQSRRAYLFARRPAA